ncbi:hypothetical protein [Aquimarina agarivorans]|uniref:hypothetical protein n=1 Tax=Aquimarina agarivorans TaxID=980584 RepID=UPI000248FD8A|nr:hypothetical protein [Aquimarina agarivorans]
MKKSILLPVVALGLLVSTQTINAQDATAEVTATETVAQDEMVVVSIEELPEPVKTALAKDYEGMTIAEAHATKDGSKYKLILTKEGSEGTTVLCDAEGNWITE